MCCVRVFFVVFENWKSEFLFCCGVVGGCLFIVIEWVFEVGCWFGIVVFVFFFRVVVVVVRVDIYFECLGDGLFRESCVVVLWGSIVDFEDFLVCWRRDDGCWNERGVDYGLLIVVSDKYRCCLCWR